MRQAKGRATTINGSDELRGRKKVEEGIRDQEETRRRNKKRQHEKGAEKREAAGPFPLPQRGREKRTRIMWK